MLMLLMKILFAIRHKTDFGALAWIIWHRDKHLTCKKIHYSFLREDLRVPRPNLQCPQKNRLAKQRPKHECLQSKQIFYTVTTKQLCYTVTKSTNVVTETLHISLILH